MVVEELVLALAKAASGDGHDLSLGHIDKERMDNTGHGVTLGEIQVNEVNKDTDDHVAVNEGSASGGIDGGQITEHPQAIVVLVHHTDTLGDGASLELELDLVEGQCDDGQSKTPSSRGILGEPQRQRHVQCLLTLGLLNQILIHIGTEGYTANGLLQTQTSTASKLLVDQGKVRVKLVNSAATNLNGAIFPTCKTNGIDVVSASLGVNSTGRGASAGVGDHRCTQGWQCDLQGDAADQITVATDCRGCL